MEDFLSKAESALLWVTAALALVTAFASLFRERLMPVLRRIVGVTPTRKDDAIVEKLDEILRELQGEPEVEASFADEDEDGGPYDA